jgi:hypothetical protein
MLWVVLLVLLVGGGGIGFAIYGLSSLVRPGGNPPFGGGLPGSFGGLKEKPAEPLTVEELPVVLKEWDGADENRKQEIARRLAVTPVQEKHRKQVVEDLESLVFRPALRQAEPKKVLDKPYPPAVEGLGGWGSKEEHGPALVQLVSTSTTARGEAMKAVTKLNDERGIAAIAERLKDGWDRDRSPARDCLISFGPRAEDEVLRVLQSGDHFTKRSAISILQHVGGKNSLAPLEEARKDISLKGDADAAIKAIQARSRPRPDRPG